MSDSSPSYRTGSTDTHTEQSADCLEANTFGHELAELDSAEHKALAEERLQSAEREFQERSTDSLSDYEGRLSDAVAAQWGTPEGSWWP